MDTTHRKGSDSGREISILPKNITVKKQTKQVSSRVRILLLSINLNIKIKVVGIVLLIFGCTRPPCDYNRGFRNVKLFTFSSSDLPLGRSLLPTCTVPLDDQIFLYLYLTGINKDTTIFLIHTHFVNLLMLRHITLVIFLVSSLYIELYFFLEHSVKTLLYKRISKFL